MSPRQRSTRVGLALVLSLLATVASAGASDHYARGKAAWRGAQYSVAVSHLLTFRSESYGRTADVDYMLGTSGCRMPNERSWGVSVLRWILANYALDRPSRALVERELSVCDSSGDIPALGGGELASSIAAQTPGAEGSGKIFYLPSDPAVSVRPARRLRQLSEEELRERRIPLTNPELITEVVTRNSHLPFVKVCHGFAIATDVSDDPARLDSVCDQLQSFTRFVQRQFSVDLPKVFVTIYLLSNERATTTIARRVHQLQIAERTLGYTIYDDFSILARAPDLMLGTAKHELVHLLVRSTFGDIPQWLDEGIASVYEVSVRCQDDFFGEANWRGQILSHLGISPLQSVFTSNYAFDEPGDDYLLMFGGAYARDMATARYFALYLQDTQRIGAVFAALRDRDPTAAPDTLELVARTLERPASELQSEFEDWYRRVGQRLSYSRGECSGASPGPPAPAPGPSLLAARFQREAAATMTPQPSESPADLPLRAPPRAPPRRSCACHVGNASADIRSSVALIVAAALVAIQRRRIRLLTRNFSPPDKSSCPPHPGST